jgi:hypothetical protein
MREWLRLTRSVGNRPPPCGLMPALAFSELRVTVVFSSVSRTGGSEKRPFQIPPP